MVRNNKLITFEDYKNCVYYFGYGSNMWSSWFAFERGMHVYQFFPAVLYDYSLKFNKKIKFVETGVEVETAAANIVPCKGDEVRGIVYLMHKDSIPALDEREQGYDKINVEVYEIENLQPTDKKFNVYTYMATGKNTDDNRSVLSDYWFHLEMAADLVGHSYLDKRKPLIFT